MALNAIPLAAVSGIGLSGLPGSRLGHYRLLERIGAGAYAAVYRAIHEVMGVERAVKVLRPQAASWPGQPAQFLREARVAARLRHPNVVAVYDCGTAADGTPYLVMDYVGGRSLAERLREGVPPPAETLHIASQLAAALDYAHSLGVVHRDVKPANVLLSADGRVGLGDFGIARLGTEPDGDEPGAGLGTPAYMAPEQYREQRGGQGPQTDVYALAVVLYEMLTGRTPGGAGGACGGNGPEHDPPPPSAVNPYIPEAVDGSLASGLARDPCRRPTSAGALVAQLAAALGEPALSENRAAAWPCASVGGEADRPTSLPPLPREAPPPSAREVPPSLSRRFAALIGAGRRRRP